MVDKCIVLEDDCVPSQFFTSVFAIWGWASWRRVFEKRDEQYAFLDDAYTMRELKPFASAWKNGWERKSMFKKIFYRVHFKKSFLVLYPTKCHLIIR